MKSQQVREETSDEANVAAGVRRWVAKAISGVLMVALFLFLPAWSVDWPMGWALVAVWVLWQAAVYVLLRKSNPGLLADRASGPREGDRRSDTVIMSIVGLMTIAVYVVAGLDRRLGWSPGVMPRVPSWLQIAALAATALAYALAVGSMVSNAHFTKIVRVEGQGGQAVATSGPYRIVRHPAYVGQIVAAVGTPVMLGSWWALIPGSVIAVLFVVRTALEDAALRAELDGYAEYAREVRFRLLPGVW
jgi:protein-S-isoprenylcysteine O-methyltransferase Ste14